MGNSILLSIELSGLKMLSNAMNRATCEGCPYIYKECEKQCHVLRSKIIDVINSVESENDV